MALLEIVGAFVLLLVVGGIVVYAVMIYNGLIRLNRNIDKAWSNIDVLLKQRSDELPKLIDTAREYMDYEQEVIENVTEARTQAQRAQGPSEEADADEAVKGALANLFAVAEDYPELKANESFQQLQDRIAEIEERIADRREFYNSSVNTYNIRINQIPYVFVANAMDYEDRELFQVSEEDRRDVDVSELFSEGGSGTEAST